MSNIIKIKSGLEANRLSYTPLESEPIFITDTKKLYVGDGVTVGGICQNEDRPSNTLDLKDINNINNLSGVNTGDQDLSSFITSSNYASSTIGGTIKTRISGSTLYITTNGNNA